MYKILNKVEYNYIFDEVYSIDIAKDVIRNLHGKPSKEVLIHFLLSYYGSDLLNNSSIRHMIINSLDDKQVNLCCQKLRKNPTPHKYDTSLLLSRYTWNRSSEFPEILNEIMYYEIPEHYLPFNTERVILPKIEKIYSNKNENLFDYQREISNSLIKFINGTKRRTMVQMPTGSGKTKTTLCAIIDFIVEKNNRFNKVLWLSHTSELCEQSLASLKRNWSNKGNGLLYAYRLYGTHHLNQYEYKDGFVFASLQKIHSIQKREDNLYKKISANCDLIVFDEAHKALAPTYKKIIDDIMQKSNNCKIIGLTATPGRTSKEESELENKKLTRIFDNNLIALEFGKTNPIVALKEKGVLSNLKRKSIHGLNEFEWNNTEKKYFEDYSEIPPSILKGLASDRKRNDNIITAIKSEVSKGKQCLVFSCTSKHAKVLSAQLNLSGITASAVTSDMTKLARYKAVDSFKKSTSSVLINFGILTTGFDAPNIDVIIITRPTNSIILYSQMLGRGLRGPKVGGNQDCILYDVIDNFLGYGNQDDIYDYFEGYWN